MKSIPLTQGQIALVDDEDFERLCGFGRWRAARRRVLWYAERSVKRNGRWTTLQMHAVVLNTRAWIDHIDGNPLNNQKANLRIATRIQNGQNRRKRSVATSQFKGVHLHVSGKWRASITINRARKSLGLFADEKQAARAYNEAAACYFGEFACLNLV